MYDNKNTKISIIIPIFNEEKTVEKLISLVEQVELPYEKEIILIDDGSADKSKEIINQYRARHKTIFLEENRGKGFAIRTGFKNATGDIVAFTDADTIVPPDWLTKIIASLNQPGISFVYSGYKVSDGWLPYRLHVNLVLPFIILFQHLIGLPFAPGQNTAFWKKLGLKVGGYPVNFKIAEDLEMARRIKSVGRIVYRSDNFVTSSGRRGMEGWPLLFRITHFYFVYMFTRQVKDLTFPDFR